MESYLTPSLCISEEMLQVMKDPSPMKVDPPRYPFLTVGFNKQLNNHTCESFFVRQCKQSSSFPHKHVIFAFHREGFSNKRGETMQCFVGGERVDFVCNEMFFKIACGAFHCHFPTVKKTWSSKDFKECTKSTREIPDFKKAEWDSLSPHVMVAGCIMKLTNGTTYDFCQHLVQQARKCGVKPCDIFFFEVNDNDIWATNHNSIKEFSQAFHSMAEDGREWELARSFSDSSIHPFSGGNMMGKCLQKAFSIVFGEDGEFSELPLWDQKVRVMEQCTVFHAEHSWGPSLECAEDMPTMEVPDTAEVSLKRCLSDVTNLPEEKRARSDEPGEGKEN